MISAIVTSDYVNAQSLQKGLEKSNTNTFIYKTDFSITDHYDFLYHDGLFIHLINPTEQHINFCLHVKNLSPGKTIFILVQTIDVDILNLLKETLNLPIFTSPFSFRNISGVYQNTFSFELGYVNTHEINGIVLKLDSTTRRLHVDNNFYIDLVNKEFYILKFLFNHVGKVVSKIDLLEFVWGKNLLGSTNTIDVHMSKLRRKLKSHLKFDPIQTIYCAGYLFE